MSSDLQTMKKHSWYWRSRILAPCRRSVDCNSSTFSSDYEISGAEKTVIFLRGNGGSGKSKVLREISLRVREKFPTKRILFLSRDSLTQKNIESLPPGPKLLVCDDAHDRDDLRSLFSFASDTENETKLIVALRTYGKELVKKQAPDLTLKEVQEIDLPKMSVADAKALATQALQRYQGNLGLAEPLALLTRDCPLATVIGAQVASEENSRPEFLLNEDSFRFVIMSRLVDTIARDVSSGLSAANVENVLKSIAIVQPLSDNDTVSLDAITKISGVNSNELAQIIRRLKDAGVLFVRAEVMRISPDLLGDFLVENSCISENGQSTGFAERAFDVVPEIYTDHIMLNLGKLDWIKSNGDTRQSHVLDELWDRIRGNQNHRYTSLLARTPLAYFQPKQALRFVERKMQEDHTDEDLPKIIRNIAYHPEYLPKACELLWQLGQHDSRQTNRTPSHPVRLLSELAAPGPTNSIDSIAIVVEYAIELIPLESSWTSNHSPLTILTNTLNTEGYTSTSTRRTWAMQPYQISSIAMKSLRQQVIGACIKLLSHPNTRRGYMAAELLKKAVQLPMGMFNVVPTQEQTNQWLEEYCETLDAIYNSLVATPINPIVFNQLAKAVSWHAIHFDGITKEPAKKILTLQNLNLHVRTVNMLMSQWENAIAPAGAEYSIEQRNSALKSFSIELQAAYPDPNLLHRYLRRNLDEIEFASSGEHRWSFGLVDALASSSAAFAEILVNEAMFQKNGIMSKFVGSALTKLLVDVPNIAEQFIAKAFDEQNEQAVMHVAIAYSRFLPENGFTKFDVETIKKLVTSSSGSIVKLAAGALGNLAWKNQEVALGMVGLINFGIDGDAADEHLMWLNNNKSLPFDKLSPDQIRQILNRLIRLDNIDGYWVKEFLHKAFKQDTYSVLNFFMQRIELALASPNTGYSPVPFNSYPGHTFSLTTLPNSTELINALLEQARAHSDNVLFRYHFAKLLEYLCAPYDATFLELLETSLDLNGNSEMNLFLMILGEAPSNLVFSNEDFVRRFLVSAKSLGPKVLEHSLYVFFQCGIGGIRSGVPGEPYPQDMALRDSAHETLSRLGRFEPAYQLYSELLEYAEAEITREKRAGRIFDEMEE